MGKIEDEPAGAGRRESRRHALGLIPYHGGAGAVLNAGAFCMLAFALLGAPRPWIGFFVGAVPVFLLFVWMMSRDGDNPS